jgi:hypothetical protein
MVGVDEKSIHIYANYIHELKVMKAIGVLDRQSAV